MRKVFSGRNLLKLKIFDVLMMCINRYTVDKKYTKIDYKK